MELPPILNKYRSEIDAELKTVIADFESPFYDMMRYHLGWIDEVGHSTSLPSGKALRSTLCLLTCEAIAGAFQKALPAAAAIELVHNFSLIHDDIQDGDIERRNRPTVWAIWGKPQAINAGTAMRVLANVSLMRLSNHGIPEGKLLKALELLDASSLRLIEGQFLDLNFEQRYDVRVEDYLAMIERKTAALIACSMELGALLVTDDPDMIHAFSHYGKYLGFAFQIKDDVLGIWGDEKKTGKPASSDIFHRKKSYPVVYAWEHAADEEKAELIELYRAEQINPNSRNRVMAILDHSGARLEADRTIERYCQLAMAEIEQAEICSWARDSLFEMTQFLTTREF